MPRAPLLRLLVPFALGILLEDRLELAPLWLWIVGACAFALRLLGPRRLGAAAEVLGVLALGALALALRLGAPVAAAGTAPVQLTLLAAPRATAGHCWLPVYVHGPSPGRAELRTNGDACLSLPGQRLLARVELQRTRPPTNPGAADQRRRRARRAIHVLGVVREGLILPVGAAPSGFRATVERLRRAVGAALDPPDRSARSGPLLRALATGERSRLDESVWAAFRDSGTAHLLAVSGLHVGWTFRLVQLALERLLRRAPALALLRRARAISLLVGLVAAAGYAALAGLGVPALRATAMAGAGCVAVLGGRPSASWNALALAGLVCLVSDPASLFEPSFSLSFAAVSGILFWRPEGGAAGRVVGCTLGAGLATAPLVAALGAPLPVLSLAANLVAVPWFASAVVPLTLISGAVASFAPCAAVWLRPLAAASAEVGVRALEALASPDLLGLVAAPFPAAVALAGAGFALRLAYRRRTGAAVALACAAGVAAVLLGTRSAGAPRDPSLLFLDVGHGDAVLLRTPSRAWLIDAGPRFGSYDAGRFAILPALRHEGIRRLDVLVLTHADRDHVGGAAAVLDGVTVGEIWLGASALEADRLRALRVAAARRGVPIRIVAAGHRAKVEDVSIRVLWPLPGLSTSGSNRASIVLRVETAHGCALLPGDAPAEVERRLAGDQAPCEVLKLAHHGSVTSSDPEWLARLAPQVAVASAGRRRVAPLPHPDVRARLERERVTLYETRRHGAVRATFAPGGLWIAPHHAAPLEE